MLYCHHLMAEAGQDSPKHDGASSDPRDRRIVEWVKAGLDNSLDRTQLIRGSLKGAQQVDFTTTEMPLGFHPYVSKRSGRGYIQAGGFNLPSTVIAMTKDLPFPEGAGAVDVPVPKFDEAGNLVPKESYILVLTTDQYGQLLAAWKTQNQERA